MRVLMLVWTKVSHRHAGAARGGGAGRRRPPGPHDRLARRPNSCRRRVSASRASAGGRRPRPQPRAGAGTAAAAQRTGPLGAAARCTSGRRLRPVASRRRRASRSAGPSTSSTRTTHRARGGQTLADSVGSPSSTTPTSTEVRAPGGPPGRRSGRRERPERGRLARAPPPWSPWGRGGRRLSVGRHGSSEITVVRNTFPPSTPARGGAAPAASSTAGGSRPTVSSRSSRPPPGSPRCPGAPGPGGQSGWPSSTQAPKVSSAPRLGWSTATSVGRRWPPSSPTATLGPTNRLAMPNKLFHAVSLGAAGRRHRRGRARRAPGARARAGRALPPGDADGLVRAFDEPRRDHWRLPPGRRGQDGAVVGA